MLDFTCVGGMQSAEVKMRFARWRWTSDEQMLERKESVWIYLDSYG